MDLWMERDYFIGKCRDCAVVRELTSHQYDPGSVPAGATCGMTFLLDLALLRGFPSGFYGFIPPQTSTLKKI